tara:strand:+ start:395 stop:514 length:120 start_codon:yes stop_codon:yes gene_type:complete
MIWDTSTDYEGREPQAMIDFVRETGARGVNGDTLYRTPT